MLFLVVVLFGLSLITFTISRIIPADPARMMLGPRASKAQVDRQREAMGLNDPYPKQYVDYVWGVLHGDFGKSTSTRRDVSTDLKRYLPGTLEMGLYAFIISTVLGVPLGVA
jgi:peptide/nickel transport system permease protein